jgi:tRNA pseudouridine55 synthase
MPLFGILNINKPAGMTSRRVVDRVARLARPAKVGHAGTLDPLATGVLIVGLGGATRLVEYVQRMPKRYRGEFLLGRESDTEDIEGNVVELPLALDLPLPAGGGRGEGLPGDSSSSVDELSSGLRQASPERRRLAARIPTLEELIDAAAALTGEIMQRPPAFSALHVAGRRAYDLARAGQTVELAPRPVNVYRLEVVAYQFPTLTLDIECSGGTYVRSLGRDLARAVGSGAVMSGLVRTAIGGFTLADAMELDSLTRESLPARLQSPLTALVGLPQLLLSDEQARRARQGLTFDPAVEVLSMSSTGGEGNEYKAIDAAGRLVAILAARADGVLAPSRTFAAE